MLVYNQQKAKNQQRILHKILENTNRVDLIQTAAVAVLFCKYKIFNAECCFDERAECVAHGLFDATSQAQTGFHTFLHGADKTAEGWARGREGRVSVGCLSHLEWDPLVLAGLTEGMSEEEDIIHSNAQRQEG